mgnify:CR=1 FL=1
MMQRTSWYRTFIALRTLLSKEVMRFLRIWTQTLLPPAITMSLYFIIFGKFIGSQIADIHGYTYIQYIVPGLVMMSIMTNAYANTASSFFLTKFNKSIEEMIVSPMPNWVTMLGFVCGGSLRGLFVGFIVLLIAFLFTHIPLSHIGIILLMAILSATVFSLGGFINAIYAKRFDDIAFIPTFVLTPLTYLGGVFYSLHQLPPFWQTISKFNPILNMVDTFRYGMLGIADLNVFWGSSLVFVLLVSLFAWAYILLEKGVGIKA